MIFKLQYFESRLRKSELIFKIYRYNICNNGSTKPTKITRKDQCVPTIHDRKIEYNNS